MVAPAIPRMPPRIGPYRILSRIASGGMAEIYLAKMSGAAGFERAVVIKRSLPHLADEPELRSTLLDEARIMARIRHPNVVSVQELAEDRDSFYLVMEYLRGENLSGLMQALRDHGEKLAPSLAVLIAAEICAGLHAAHELTDDDGKALHVVHRDVSPQNVFLTFDGEVKLLDFGIARYDDRAATRTKTGICKGKFAYMAPEQYGGEIVDRRADVFAAGVILHELLTGERLFARNSDVQMLKAVLTDRIPTPSERAPGLAISEALEAIVMKALAREPGERFATAEAMRLALRAQLRELDPEHDARERLIELAIRVLPARLAETQELLRRAHEETPSGRPQLSLLPPPPPPPRAALDAATKAESPNAISAERTLDDDDVVLLSASELEVVVDPPSAPRVAVPRRRVIALGATVVGLVLIGVATAAVLPHAIADTPVPPTTVPPVAPPAADPPVAPPEPATVRVRVDTDPPGATVQVAGDPRCESPCEIELERDARPIEIALEEQGYVRQVHTLVPEVDHRLVVQLMPAPRRGAARVPRPRPAATAAPAPPTVPLAPPRFYPFEY